MAGSTAFLECTCVGVTFSLSIHLNMWVAQNGLRRRVPKYKTTGSNKNS